MGSRHTAHLWKSASWHLAGASPGVGAAQNPGREGRPQEGMACARDLRQEAAGDTGSEDKSPGCSPGQIHCRDPTGQTLEDAKPRETPRHMGHRPRGAPHPAQRQDLHTAPGGPQYALGCAGGSPSDLPGSASWGGGSNSDLRSLTLSFRICTMGVMQWHSLASVRSVAIDTSESLHHYSVRVDGGGELGPSTSQVMHTHAHSARILSRHFLI